MFNPAVSKSRWRFSLRTLLLAMMLIALASWYVGRVREQEQLVAELEAANAWVTYDYESREHFACEIGRWLVGKCRGMGHERTDRLSFAPDWFAQVSDLHLLAVEPTQMPPRLFRRLPHLRSLTMFGSTLSHKEMLDVGCLSGLQDWEVQAGEFLDEDEIPWESLPKLRRLDLSASFTELSDKSLRRLRDHNHLEMLSLRGSFTAEAVQELACAKSLIALRLAGDLDPAIIPALVKFEHLATLELSSNRITAADVERLPPLPWLNRLSVPNTDLSDAAFHRIWHCCPELGSLNASGSGISNEAVTAIPRLNLLESFRLCNSNLTDDGVSVLLERATLLRVLEINGAVNVTGKFLDHGGASYPRLEELRLAGCKIGDDQVGQIACLFPELRELCLRGTLISDEGLAGLECLSSQWLPLGHCGAVPRMLVDVNDTTVTRDGIKDFHAASPGIAVYLEP